MRQLLDGRLVVTLENKVISKYLSLIYNGDLTFLKVKIFSGWGGTLRDQKEYLAVTCYAVACPGIRKKEGGPKI